jgi:hypothetical protein
MFCHDFTDAVKYGTIGIGDMTDKRENTICLDFVVKVNGTSAKVNYCPFCSRVVRGRYELADVSQVMAAVGELPSDV